MVNQRAPHSPPNSLDRSDLLTSYSELSSAILDMPPGDIGHQLPGLAERVASLARGTENIREVVIGVSYTKNYSLFDYELYGVGSNDGDDVVTTVIKEPIDERHHYISFPYPVDPHFDNTALRGALLAELSRRIRELRKVDERQEDRSLADVWGLLASPRSAQDE